MTARHLVIPSSKIWRVLVILFNVALPGAGHLLVGYSVRGLSLFFLYGFLIDAVLIGLYCPVNEPMADRLIFVSALIAFLLWSFSIYDIYWRCFGRYCDKVQAEKMKLFRSGLVHYLNGNVKTAIKEFKFVLRLDNEDVDALYYLGMSFKEVGCPYKALRAFKQCQAYDNELKWRSEISCQIREIHHSSKNLH